MRNLPGICHLPNQLYKFYRFDPQYNESRLKGEIYLANALQFNDPLDCRIDVLNNTKDKAPEFYLDGWLDHKLRELNFRGKYQREEIGNNLLNDDRETVQMVWQKQLEKMGIICLEMEAAALYMNAARWNKKALAIFTISDEIYSGRELSAEDRQKSFTKMMELALETAV